MLSLPVFPHAILQNILDLGSKITGKAKWLPPQEAGFATEKSLSCLPWISESSKYNLFGRQKSSL
jgi:hypothetical protein